MQQVLEMEAQMLKAAADRISEEQVTKLTSIFDQLNRWGGSLIICGVGKSGLVGHKISATFCSLGLPSTSLHPVEALHGDLGRVRKGDAIVFISKSGTTEEILKLIPFLPIEKDMRIALLGNPVSAIAKECGLVLDCFVESEACLNNQAPTTSSTLALAMGDAMAVLYEAHTNLTKEQFATFHPSGLLGKSMLMKVKDLMIDRDQCARVFKDATLKEVILQMTKQPVGGCAVIDANQQLLGIVVEGDIRRTLAGRDNALSLTMEEVMNPNPTTTGPMVLARDALAMMESKKKQFSILPVVDGKEFLGFLRLHDLIKEGFSFDQK